MNAQHLRIPRRASIATVLATLALALVAATPVSAYEADASLTQSAQGTLAVSCQTPNPAGAEASPTISSSGVTVPSLVTPPIDVPPVTLGPFQVGPETVGPLSTGGYSVPSETIPGGTFGSDHQLDRVAAAGASTCIILNVTNPTVLPAATGQLTLVLELAELNPNTGAIAFTTWAQTAASLVNESAQLQCVDCPNPPQVYTVLAGTATDLEIGVPGAGQIDGRDGNVSMGLAQVYVGVSLTIDSVQQPTGAACVAGDFSCSNSGVFPVY